MLTFEQRNIAPSIGARNADANEVRDAGDPRRVDDVSPLCDIALRPRPVECSRSEHGVDAGRRTGDRAHVVEVDRCDLGAAAQELGRRLGPSRPCSNTMTGGQKGPYQRRVPAGRAQDQLLEGRNLTSLSASEHPGPRRPRSAGGSRDPGRSGPCPPPVDLRCR